ncbi:hypothetical protein F2P81_023315 [Scophthalmus maximus]|uniref:Uncharacterized protein n=1 Tax=Scophthalmus maximus TaxID=52904 RepID=A0A6A4RR55_SCOMX|nr:hypothetical protein F2P81_023315 [Scophthalmus maximus]
MPRTNASYFIEYKQTHIGAYKFSSTFIVLVALPLLQAWQRRYQRPPELLCVSLLTIQSDNMLYRSYKNIMADSWPWHQFCRSGSIPPRSTMVRPAAQFGYCCSVLHTVVGGRNQVSNSTKHQSPSVQGRRSSYTQQLDDTALSLIKCVADSCEK